MNDRLRQLYQEVILAHNKNPFHFEKREAFPIVLKAYNPICGDKFELYISEEGGKIGEIYFHGFGCAISKAATSVLAEHLQGKGLDQASKIVGKYLHSLSHEGEGGDLPEAFAAFEAAREFPGRMKCASLSWEEFNKWLGER